uniref:Uncharacterized protein n=1 Tax=Moniliophthora roreri TaxID=221103 RepID=A0A0W0EUK6_MONRR
MERVDDTDLRMEYSPDTWFKDGSPEEHNGTSHGSWIAPAEMTFRFNGTYVAVHGTISPVTFRPRPIDLFLLDDQDPAEFSPVIDGIARQHQRLYSSPRLTDGFHTLILRRTVHRSAETWIDYIDFMPSSTAFGGSSTSPATPTSPSATGGSQQNGSNGGALSTGTLIGIVVACTVLLASLVFLVLWIRKRRQRSQPVFEANVLPVFITSQSYITATIEQSHHRMFNQSRRLLHPWSDSRGAGVNTLRPTPFMYTAAENPPPYGSKDR